MNNIVNHFKKYLIRGFLGAIPLILTFFIIRFIYLSIDREIASYLRGFINYELPGIGVLITVLLFYLTGVLASYFIGKKIFSLLDLISQKIPVVRSIYKIGKQISSAFSMPDKQVFKRVVLVEFFKPGSWAVGFVTGQIYDVHNRNEKLFKIYIPTPPIPTSGNLLFVKEKDIRETGWSVDDALKVVVSGGIISPEEFGLKNE